MSSVSCPIWARRPRSLICLLPFAQNGADFHEDEAEPVLASAVGAVSPVVIVRGVFDQFLLAGGEQDRSDVVVLLELAQDGPAHDVVLDALPVAPERRRAVPPEPSRFLRSFRRADVVLMRGAGELLGLEVVLG